MEMSREKRVSEEETTNTKILRGSMSGELRIDWVGYQNGWSTVTNEEKTGEVREVMERKVK